MFKSTVSREGDYISTLAGNPSAGPCYADDAVKISYSSIEHGRFDSIVGVHLANNAYTYLDRLLNDDCTTVSQAAMTVAER